MKKLIEINEYEAFRAAEAAATARKEYLEPPATAYNFYQVVRND